MDQSVHESALAEARQAGRYDLYLNIHCALRLYMTDTLARFGRLDASDDENRESALEQLRDLLEWLMPALPHGERLVMLTGMRDHAPAPVFDGAAQIARRRLPERDWQRLANALAVGA